MEDVGEFLERLGRTLGRMERRQWRGGEHGTDQESSGGPVERDLVFGEQAELDLSADQLTVQIVEAAPGETPRLELRGRGAESAQLEVETVNSTVRVRVHSGGPFGFNGRDNRLTVYLPAGARVRGRVDAGAISAVALKQTDLDLRADAGKVEVEDCSGRLRLRSSAGRVRIDRFSGLLEAHTDAGTIRAESLTLEGGTKITANAGSVRCSGVRLGAGTHTIETSLGSVRLGLLPDVPVQIDAHATLGSVNNAIGSGTPDAPATLKLRSELGSVRVYYDEAPPSAMRRVPIADERPAVAGPVVTAQPVPPAPIPVDGEQPATATPPIAPIDFEAARSDAQPAPPQGEDAALRILGMLERHEITANEAAVLLSALQRPQ